jgi:cyclophilin family peptidyl-prolyl cis-trans isomerase
MGDGLRPRLYLLICLAALIIEATWIVGHAPPLCSRCRKPLGDPYPQLPDLCRACVDEIRVRLPQSTYVAPYPIDTSDPVVALDTSRGQVLVELFSRQAPLSVANFLHYVHAKSYDGVIFHRVETYICVTGRFRGGYAGAPLAIILQLPPIPTEAKNGIQNKLGTIALPRQDADPNSATGDFFFNYQDNPFYDWRGSSLQETGYAVFGQVVRGYEVLEGLKYLPVASLGAGCEKAPRDPVTIVRAYEVDPATLGLVAALGSASHGGR